MMTKSELEAILARIEYRHAGLTAPARFVVSESGFADAADGGLNCRMVLQLPDSRQPNRRVDLSVPLPYLASFSTEKEVIDAVLMEARGFGSHEVEEWFHFDGQRCVDPHEIKAMKR